MHRKADKSRRILDRQLAEELSAEELGRITGGGETVTCSCSGADD